MKLTWKKIISFLFHLAGAIAISELVFRLVISVRLNLAYQKAISAIVELYSSKLHPSMPSLESLSSEYDVWVISEVDLVVRIVVILIYVIVASRLYKRKYRKLNLNSED